MDLPGDCRGAHGGRIWIEIGDAGTTVLFALPCVDGSGENASAKGSRVTETAAPS
jgi:hypothetical protein